MSVNVTAPDTVYSLAEAAALLSLAPCTLRTQAELGRITVQQLGGPGCVRVVLGSEIARYAREQLGHKGRGKGKQ